MMNAIASAISPRTEVVLYSISHQLEVIRIAEQFVEGAADEDDGSLAQRQFRHQREEFVQQLREMFEDYQINLTLENTWNEISLKRLSKEEEAEWRDLFDRQFDLIQNAERNAHETLERTGNLDTARFYKHRKGRFIHQTNELFRQFGLNLKMAEAEPLE